MDKNKDFRPHSSLGDMSPSEFIEQHSTSPESRKSNLLAGSVFGQRSLFPDCTHNSGSEPGGQVMRPKILLKSDPFSLVY